MMKIFMLLFLADYAFFMQCQFMFIIIDVVGRYVESTLCNKIFACIIAFIPWKSLTLPPKWGVVRKISAGGYRIYILCGVSDHRVIF